MVRNHAFRATWPALAALALALPGEAMAQQAAKIDGADTAWILTSTALVLFMTIPGLALFYGGLVGSRNVLSVLMHCFSICCLASVVWYVVAYSIAFGDGGGALGIMLTSFLALPALNGLGLADGFTVGTHVWVQFVGLAATAAWAGGLSYAIIKLVGATVGLRVSDEDETEGLDITTHGERSYDI